MDKNVFQNIFETISNFRGLSKDCYSLLQEKFPEINEDALVSILSIVYQKRMKCNYSKSPASVAKVYGLYCESVERGDEPGIILRMAEQFDIAPCLIAKLILQKYYRNMEIDELSTTVNVKKCLRDTTLIENSVLAYEVYLCTIYDNLYSPIVDAMKSSLGQQYEIKLYRQLTELGLAFRDEQDLRKFGYDKTPDVKLEIPVAIGGFVIHWVESKALFGEDCVHRDYLKNQYSSYWNRFGPGLVIYWFGFVETIVELNEKRFIISDKLPSNIVQILKT